MPFVQLENESRTKYGSDKNISDYIDLITGTSTGGILAIGLCIPGKNDIQKYNAQDLLDIYVERGDEIFDISVWKSIMSVGGLNDEKYDASELEDALKDYFGNIMLCNLLKHCLITSYDFKRRKAHFFRKSAAINDSSNNFLVRDVARATSATPTYFETARIKSNTNITYPLIVGGLFANNPSMCAYAEARYIHNISSSEEMSILSLGTGESKNPYSYPEAKDWGVTSWIKPVIDIMSTAVSETTDFQLQQIFSSSNYSDHYLHIQSTIPSWCSTDMDNASTDNIQALQDVSERIASDNKSRLKDFVMLLA
ncbi:MAG: patatin-like phospholipase family protein [Thiohalomonadales bacterium]